ncbi:LLM class flavin-dependent oxidoreductase [Haloferax volcanii]|uniref:Luciferase-like monooxygenase n=3 Tax=Haloferax volcanii TaxID=2246 RepID=A0A384LD73_HALVD|nr:LLM class flavin-dependent oxidoreductase [Haloferax volcanii]ADE01783.1 luciferase-type oxidoreductase [Haloferax volcanii DS2]ELY37514.1 Luciferase-like monooxygenase [Haloferax volcanii DS2]MBS8120820.1 LLM class flavin-dependent oxidoreductase [Haloferax volcanii]MBS8125857.1 LLM class flavin-dependent oxidoreductase [Haloferax volcanii]MBS8129710.1 LLM class flavin-dependent oxidoreductase [Haloferax volcanii]
MKLGTGLFTCQRRPDDDRAMADLYDEMLTLGREIDDAGLDSAWVSEHHFMPDGYLSGTMPALGALGAATESVELGTCIALAPLYDPIRLAEDAATVDLISGGRTTLGLAIGSNPREFDAFGVPRDERVDRLADAVSLLRDAWSDGPIAHESPFHEGATGVDVTPKPAHDVPLMLGGAAKPAVRRAARTADAWCAPSSLSLDGVRKRVEDIRSVREAEGLDGEFTIYVLQHGFVGDSKAEAWDAMRDGYLYLQRRYAEMFSGDEVHELSDERRAELKAQAVFGTPDDVVAELDRYRDALGDDIHFIFRTYYPGIGTDRMVESVRRLGDEVRPRLA